MTAFTFVLRDTNVLNIQSTKQPLKPILRSVSAPLLPPSPTLKAERPIERTVTAQPQSIFRSVGVSDELEDMWTLKRATPIFDEDDEEDHFESPIKRSRSTYDPSPEERDEQSAARQELSWNCQIREDENGYTLVL